MEKNLHILMQKGKYGLAMWRTIRRMIFLWRIRPWRRKKKKGTVGRRKQFLLAAKNAKYRSRSVGKEIKWMGRLLKAVRKQYF